MSDPLHEETFAQGMTLIYATWHRLSPPEKTISFIWFKMLSDIPDDIFLKSCLSISTGSGRVPDNIVSAIREEAEKLSGKMDWNEAYKIIEDTFRQFYFPEFGSCCWDHIQNRFREIGHPELIPVAQEWGRELLFTGNPTGVRAQFRDNWKLERGQSKLKRIGEARDMKQIFSGIKLIGGK